MRFVIFTHSLVSDWYHGNAHFLRGMAAKLIARGYDVRIFEPKDGWSRRNLIQECGEGTLREFERAYPGLQSETYAEGTLDLERALDGADTRVFRPMPEIARESDAVWIGNWGDGERAEELREFLIEPVRRLRLKARVYGVRFPEEALRELAAAGIEYGGWLPNHRVPEVFARHRLTVHIPRRPYVWMLQGIPTIRPFEALACGIPMVSALWEDTERLFRPGIDYLAARNGDEMTARMRAILESPALAADLARAGLTTIRKRHTCSHRVDELLSIVRRSWDAEAVGNAV